MLLAHKSDLLYLSKGPFQSQTYTLYHLQPTPAKLSVTKLQAPRSPFPMLKGNETCTIASSQTLMAAQLNTHLNLHRRTHPPLLFFFFLGLPSSHRTPPSGRLTKWSCSGGMIYLLNRRIRFWEPSFFTWGWHRLRKSHKETVHDPEREHRSFLWLCPAVLYNVFFFFKTLSE